VCQHGVGPLRATGHGRDTSGGVLRGPVLEDLLHGLARLLLGLLEGGLVDRLLQVHVHGIPGGHQMVEIDALQERLHLGSLGDFSLGHALGHLFGVTVNANNHGVRKLAIDRTIIVGLDNDGLTASVSTRQHHHNLSRFNNSHVAISKDVLPLRLLVGRRSR